MQEKGVDGVQTKNYHDIRQGKNPVLSLDQKYVYC